MNDPRQYLLDIYDPHDTLAVLLLKKDTPSRQHILEVERITSPSFLRYLHQANDRDGFNVYHGQAVLQPNAPGRRTEHIAYLKTLYADIDQEGQRKLAEVLASQYLPKPNWIMQTSPDRYQLVWKMEPQRNLSEAGRYLRGLCLATGADPQAVDVARTTRIPGFLNVKPEYPGKPLVEAVQHPLAMSQCSLDSFKVKTDIPARDWQTAVYRTMGKAEGHALDYQRQFRDTMSHLRSGMPAERVERLLARRYEALGVSRPEGRAHYDVERAQRKLSHAR